ncbi:MAG: phosphoadenylyl-sulfate reductase [Bacteroidales bacterium]
MIQQLNLNALNEQFNTKSPDEVLRFVLQNFQGDIIFSTSLQSEDQVLTDIICRVGKDAVTFVTLDTGRMFEQTYDILQRTNVRYNINIGVLFPQREEVEKMVKENGINLFYESVENRKLCCHIRKTIPLMRALKEHHIWITGLRRSQSVTRKELKMFEWDDVHRMVKVNPLINFTLNDVWQYIRKNDVPYHKLHDHGYPSIGCEPCTRAVKSGEEVRAGRWWWESPESRECGLHIEKINKQKR